MTKKIDKYDLLTKHMTQESTTEEDAHLQDILEKDSNEAKRYQLLKYFWQHCKPIVSQKHSRKIHKKVLNQVVAKPKSRSRFYLTVSHAAAILLTGITMTLFFQIIATKEAANMTLHQTGIGEIKTIQLPDSSVVTLNSSSTLVIPSHFQGTEREVVLIGEGFFQVTKKEHQPFRVQTSHINVEVLGTEFNVSAYESDEEITAYLKEGGIQLLGDFAKHHPIVMKPGQEAILNKTNMQINIQQAGHLQNDWRQGQFRFTNQPLSVIVPKLERRFGVEIILMDEAIKNARYTGQFNSEDIIEILSILQATKSFTYKIDQQMILISSE
jgi:ferric-dicitrate binding protein FerR (iron transport regulator)